MKKIVGIIAAAALATSAFAEINIGSWSRGAFVPFAYDGDDVRALEGANWDGANSAKAGVRVGLSFSASAEDVVGINADVFSNAGASGEDGWGIGDNANIWFKPIDMLTVKFGKIDNSWGRQDVCFGMWDHTWRFGGRLSEGEGVAAWRDHADTGAEITLQPVDGLVIDYQGGFGAWNKDKWGEGTNHVPGNSEAYDVLYHNADLMVGYTAEDIGFFRAILAPQFPSLNNDGDSTEWFKIGLAADIWAVENLSLSFGVTIPTLFSVNELPEIPVGVGATYNMDSLAIHGLAKLTLCGNANDDNDGVEFGKVNELYLGAGVDFAINDMFTLIADARVDFGLGDSDYVEAAGLDKADLGIYLGLAQNLAGATFDFGVQLATNTAGASRKSGEDGLTVAIPLMITVGF